MIRSVHKPVTEIDGIEGAAFFLGLDTGGLDVVKGERALFKNGVCAFIIHRATPFVLTEIKELKRAMKQAASITALPDT